MLDFETLLIRLAHIFSIPMCVCWHISKCIYINGLSHKKWHDSLFLFRIKIASFLKIAHLWTDQNGNQNSRLILWENRVRLIFSTQHSIYLNTYIYESINMHTLQLKNFKSFLFDSLWYLVWFDLHKGGHKTRIFIWPTLISCAMGARSLKPIRSQILCANTNIIWLNKLQCFAAEQIKD